jgi:biopolymer transport protein ExbD
VLLVSLAFLTRVAPIVPTVDIVLSYITLYVIVLAVIALFLLQQGLPEERSAAPHTTVHLLEIDDKGLG